MPKEQYDLYILHRNKVLEESKSIDWVEKALLQFKFEKGDFDDVEPIIREDLFLLAYGK